GPGPVKGQLPGCRDGASKDADASVFDASDSGASRVARFLRAVPAKSGTCAFRRAIPLVGGRERNGIRANPATAQQQGASMILSSLFRVVPRARQPFHPYQTLAPCQREASHVPCSKDRKPRNVHGHERRGYTKD